MDSSETLILKVKINPPWVLKSFKDIAPSFIGKLRKTQHATDFDFCDDYFMQYMSSDDFFTEQSHHLRRFNEFLKSEEKTSDFNEKFKFVRELSKIHGEKRNRNQLSCGKRSG